MGGFSFDFSRDIRDKTMGDKFIWISNDEKQN